MTSSFKNLLRRYTPELILRLLRWVLERFDPYVVLSYSQDGEDMVLRRIFERQDSGFYVDVGAHHPRRFSNTFHFSRRGWTGINIDASPESVNAFVKECPSDINVCVGVSETSGELLYHMFNEPALNTFDAALAAERSRLAGYHLLGTRNVPVRRLDELLTEHLPPGQGIDFMSIDVEGFDLLVLRSGDWTRFRPRVLLVEARERTFAALGDDPINLFAESIGYRLIAKTLNTLIYEDGSLHESVEGIV